MNISTKGHYGMHAMMDLAERYGEGPLFLRDLCAPHSYSEKYLEQLLRLLKQEGMLESSRGAKGGYWLARSPSEITVLEVIEALEGSLHRLPSKCRTDCPKHNHCAMLELWREATEAVRKKLASVTLADLVEKQKELDAKHAALDYSI